jgi:cytochrome P450
MFSARPAAEHSVRKRLISHVYSKSYIQSSTAASAQARVILFERLLPILESSVTESQVPHGIDIYSVFMAATMDFIASYIFGLSNGTDFLGDRAYREHFLELYKARNDYGYYDQEMPQLTKFCRKLGIPFCPGWVDAANKELGEWCRRLCANMEHLLDSGCRPHGSSVDQPVVWNALVSGLQNEKAKNGQASVLHRTAMSNFKLSVASELFDHFLAGQETAGLTLTYLSWRLSQSPELQGQLRAELLSLSPNMRAAEDSTPELPDAKQLDSLPLLHAVLMETLRLHAPIPGAQPRQTPESGCRIGPYHVPGGVRIAALAYALHRDESVFPEPEKWDHTRWLPSCADEEDRKRRNRQFWAFSSGGRMCIGSNFAMHGESGRLLVKWRGECLLAPWLQR